MMGRSAIVVGAGAAGLGAAYSLVRAGIAVTVVEARKRIGGRVQTHYGFAPVPVELGAELIHGEGAVTVGLAQEAGIALAPVDRYGALRWADGGPARHLHALPPALRGTIRNLRAAYAALVAADTTSDRSLGAELRAQGFDAAALAVADVLLAQTCCATVDDLSVADLARELRVDRAGPREFRPVGGYAPLLAWLGRGAELRLGTPVASIRRERAGVAVAAGGELLRADACVVALPVSLLADATVAFDPPLPAVKRDAIAAFRTEPATKIVFRFDRSYWDPELTYMAHEGLFSRWWTPAHHLPGLPLLCCYVTAERARAVDTLDDGELRRGALDELTTLLGEPRVRDGCQALLRSAWASDPLARGGYAHLPPGAADARLALAAPLDGGIFFAGEATAHDSNPQTVHGAIESGFRAAAELLASFPASHLEAPRRP
jgi:monoamine oxidase